MTTIRTLAELERVFGTDRRRFMEVWAERPNDGAVCALINGELGWLMFLRAPGDAGFSSRNPGYAGPSDALIEYWLDNGQRDRYPASWAVDVATIVRALREFLETGSRPPSIAWHDDAETQCGGSNP